MSVTTVWLLLLASNPACVFLGFLIGRVTRATVEIEEHMTAEEEDRKEREDVRRRIGRRITGLQVIAGIVVLIGLVTALVGYNVTRNQDRLTGCVVGYSNSLADTLDRRAAPQQEATDHIYEVMETIVRAYASASPEAQAAVRAAIEEAVEARAKAKAFLKENPLPEAPRDACAELLD